MKRISKVAIAMAVLMSLVLAPPVSAESKVKSTKFNSAKCKPTKAIGHLPKIVAPSDRALRRIPRIITLQTNCGDIVISTVGVKAAITITQIVTLARAGFFDDSLCHRLTTKGAFVLQCGDPTGSGEGGPNFVYPDENLPADVFNNYPEGTVAMRNRGPAPDGSATNGSQFFLVFGDTTLPPKYTIWGTVIQGLDIVRLIAKAGVKGGGVDGSPNQSIAILRVVVSN